MNRFSLLLLIAVSSTVMATTPISTPTAVPLLDGWGLLALGAGVALAGVIGAVRLKKKN